MQKNITLESIKKVHCIGIGGIGVSAVAKLLHSRGVEVAGSDIEESFITKELMDMGIAVTYGQREENIGPEVQAIIYTPAAQEENPERRAAFARNIPQFSYPEFLGELSRTMRTIAISGTHGKSTTTAMVGLVLEAAGYDPTVIVGSRVPAFPMGNVRVGKSHWLVVEACEYQGNMRFLYPWITVITAIEEDHLDYYKDIHHIVATFQEFVDKTDRAGTVIYNASDEQCNALTVNAAHAVGFAYETKGDWVAQDRVIGNGEQTFKVEINGERLGGEWSLKIPGSFNVLNALAASAAAFSAGVHLDVIKKTIAQFGGIWRRFEKIGVMNGVGAHVVSDYGHHPTAVRATVKAAREHFPGHRVVLVYQPHQHNRTKRLFDDFVESLAMPDVLILSEIYDVAGREAGEDQNVSSMDIVDCIMKRQATDAGWGPKTVVYAAGVEEARELARSHAQPDDVILIMGAGDIWKVGPSLVEPQSKIL